MSVRNIINLSSSSLGRLRRGVLGLVILSVSAATASATTVTVSNFGDQGWYSDDTRDASGVNLVGSVDTYLGKPGQMPTAADDLAIAQQIQFVPGPAGSTYGGAVSLDGTSGNSGKSNISVVNAAGFDSASNLLSNAFSASYEWYGQPNPTSRTVAFKLGIQSTSYGTGAGQSQETFTATKSGESIWDLVLVNTGAASDNAWSTVNLDHDTGTWILFRQSGNGYFTTAPDNSTAKTLDAWSLDPDYGSLLFGAGAKVTSVQFGLGSSQRQSIAYVDYLQTSLLNSGDVINFAPVPEPSTMVLAGLGLIGLGLTARKRKQQ